MSARFGHWTLRTSRADADLKSDLRKSLERLQTLRDEVRVRLHLGTLEVKDQWRKLEPHLGDVEKRAEELTEASRAAIHDALKRLENAALVIVATPSLRWRRASCFSAPVPSPSPVAR